MKRKKINTKWIDSLSYGNFFIFLLIIGIITGAFIDYFR